MADERTVVHVTHEAAGKVGGIGAVLEGLFTCNSYIEAVDRSILIGPLFSTQGPVSGRLGENGEVLYSSIDGFGSKKYQRAFRKIEDFYKAGIVYGRRTFFDRQTGARSSPEVVLVDVRFMDKKPVDEFKRRLFEEFGIRSDLYEHLWEYEQYVRLAPPAICGLRAIGAAQGLTTVVAHEFMGMPTALAAILEPSYDFKTAFYAHEVATMRRIVEEHPGHDTTFYNVIRQAANNNVYVNDVFGDQSSYFKHPLVEASRHCDVIWAVGDYVPQELRFLAPEFKSTPVDVVYNGIPAFKVSVAEKLQSREKLRQYCERLLGYNPDFVFTHVTRLVRSKGLWRDLRVLYAIEKEFRRQGKTGVLFLLSTETAQRPGFDIHNMESAYHWPVAHREGWPDLSGGEASFFTAIQEFNARSRSIKIIFVNQFGFEARHCGKRMPEEMEFMDIRKGTDVEFGQSIYEPFGIAVLEALTFGGICVLSSVCGCTGLVRHAAGGENIKNVIIADYANLNDGDVPEIEELLQIDSSAGADMDDSVSKEVAKQIIGRLPKKKSHIESMIQTGYNLARNMSWDVVVKDYLLPGLQKASRSQRTGNLWTRA